MVVLLIKLIFPIILTLGIVFPVFSKEQKNCYQFSNTLEIDSCFNDQLKEYDSKLNKTYQSILRKLKNKEGGEGAPKGYLVETLKNAQREWVIFRDRNCTYYSDFYWRGSASGTESVACNARMTKERLDELSKILDFLTEKYNLD